MRSLSHILLNPRKAERHPFEMMIVGFFYASISLWLALWVFPDHASIVMVFFTVLSSLYIVQGAIIIEEKKEKDTVSEKWLLKEHAKTINFFLFLFIGFLLAFVFWVIVLPQPTINDVFAVQIDAVRDIQTLTGNAILDTTGKAVSNGEAFGLILSNNLRVMFLSLLFAVFYGAGAIFILAWNASVMGFVIGELARNTFGLTALPLLFTRYFLHGIPEMVAYFVAALAGGIIFVTVIKGDFKRGRIKRTLIDTSLTIGIAVGLLVIAALIEVWVSPYV